VSANKKRGQILAVIRSGEVAGYERDSLEAYGNVVLAEKNLQFAKDFFNGKLFF
jgi:cobalt-zinc-cadmium efflux system membrane fusion protein